jgi:steroid delta-isomerase-like uncharacterized protein
VSRNVIDPLARALGAGRTRRGVAKSVAGGLVLAGTFAERWNARAQDATPDTCPATTPEENTALVDRYWAEVWTAGGAAAISDLLADDELHHWGIGGDTVGRAEFAERLAAFLTAFPDFAIRADQTVAEDDLVAARWTATATQQGEWLGIPPTGNSVKYTGINIFRIACGQIAESWGEADHLGLLRQLGGLPDLALPEEVEATPAPLTTGATPCPPATPDENRAAVARWFNEAVNPGELERLGDVLSPDFVAHTTGFPDAVGPEAMVGVFQTLREAFPDLQFTVEPGPAEGDYMVERWTATGTNSAPFQGLGPTGQQLQWTGINIYRVTCGRIVETWTEADTLGRLRQLGGLPDMGASAAATPTA